MNDRHVQNPSDLITLEGGAEAIVALVSATRRLRPSEKGHWGSRLEHSYGDLQGQRALDVDAINARLKQSAGSFQSYELVIAMEAYFSLICLMLAAAALRPNPEKYLDSLGKKPLETFRSLLARIIDGSEFEQFAVYGLRESTDLQWVVEAQSDEELCSLQVTARGLALYWAREIKSSGADDVTQPIHSALFPKNLMHSTGQFFSPSWLAERLVRDVRWDGDGLFIDPFCGSGIFLLRAIRAGMERGHRLGDLLKRCIGIDISPVATIAAQCNLVVMAARFRDDPSEPISINILNADSLAPAVVKGRCMNSSLFPVDRSVRVGGEKIFLPDFADPKQRHHIFDQLAGYGFDLRDWMGGANQAASVPLKNPEAISLRDRKILEQLAIFCLAPADVLGTNPPWVGWEYMSRPYRAEIQSAWDAYGLFNSKGLEASFLKEDLSTLATVASWDLYLKDGGRSVVVIKPSTMKGDLTGRGVRRLSVFPEREHVCLELVREFENIDVFQDARAEACSWQIRKGERTTFPASVKTWVPSAKRLKPSMAARVEEVEDAIRELPRSLDRTSADDLGSRWLITDRASLDSFENVRGKNNLIPRMGVFTGGANAIFYVERVKASPKSGVSHWKNVTERAKRLVPESRMLLEDALVRPVLRGRDIQPWHAAPAGQMLFPHTTETRMLPLEENILRQLYPLASDYLAIHRDILECRKGFAGWEKKIHEKYFYTLQRIGEYTFQPYKVCWKYIASEFVVCVLGVDPSEYNVLPNDKVMFVGFSDKNEAFYFGGVLSSRIVRNFINSGISKRQISANALRALRLPPFEVESEIHQRIAYCCLEGHLHLKRGDVKAANKLRSELDDLAIVLYSNLSKLKSAA